MLVMIKWQFLCVSTLLINVISLLLHQTMVMTINGFYLTGMFYCETLYLIIDGYWYKKNKYINHEKKKNKIVKLMSRCRLKNKNHDSILMVFLNYFIIQSLFMMINSYITQMLKAFFHHVISFYMFFVLQAKHGIISLHQLIHAFSWKHIVMDI